jgi:O-antigen/teichoic acid export membrane protein
MTEVPGEVAIDPTGEEGELTSILDSSEAGATAIRGSVFRLGGYGLSVVLGIVGVAALTRHLQAADYGRFSVVQSLVAIVTGIAELGLISIGVREYSTRRGRDRDAMLANLQGMRIALGCFGLAVTLVFGVIAGYTSAMLIGLVLMGIALVLTASQTTLAIPLSAGLRWGWITGFDLLRQAGQVALFLVLVAAGAGLVPFFAAGIPVGIAVLALNAWLVRRHVPLLPAFERARWREMGRLVAPYAASAAVASIYVYAAAVAMSLVADAREVGLFAASFRIYLVVAGVPSLLAGAAFPIIARAARDDHERLAYASERLLGTMLIVGVWAGLMTVVLAELGIKIVAGPSYTASVHVLQVQGIAVIAAFFTVTVGSILVSLHRYRELSVMASAALVLSCVLSLSLAGEHGAIAGGIANAGAESLGAAIALWYLHRAGQSLHYLGVLLTRVVLAAGIASAVLLLGLRGVAAAVAITAIYLLVLLGLRAIPPELLEAVPRLRRSP